MKLYRIVKDKHIASAWSGFGAKQFGGRWNHPGKSAVYTSSTISLAILEILVHLQHSQLLSHFTILQTEINPALLEQLDYRHLSQNWNGYPASDETRDIGDSWLNSNHSLGLIVPSAVVPLENNIILNPNHPNFSQLITIAKTLPLPLDPRLFHLTRHTKQS